MSADAQTPSRDECRRRERLPYAMPHEEAEMPPSDDSAAELSMR